MSLWKNRSQSNGGPLFAPAQKNLAPTLANANNLYNANSSGANLTVISVSDANIAANRALPHTGWNIKTTGSGGRAGRVQYECLVAGGTKLGVGAGTITISVDVTDKSVNTGLFTTFSVGATCSPTQNLVYQWKNSVNSTAAFANIATGGIYSNVTTATLYISNVATANQYRYQCLVMTEDPLAAANVTSANATLTVV